MRPRIKRGRIFFLSVVILGALAALPLCFVLIPPSVDLAEHIVISKLLWEKLAGVSHLDIEVSSYLGYRLVPYSIAALISVFRSLGFSLIYLPKAVALALIALHTAFVTTILYFTARRDSDRPPFIYAAIFSLPAIVVMYSACWFMGFVNFTLAISFVVLAIALTESFLRTGRTSSGLLLFIALALAFMSHPFAPVFWVAWGFWRGIMSIVALNFPAEWKRLVVLPIFFLPILIYNYFATRNTELELSGPAAAAPFVSFHDWLHVRMGEVFSGSLLAADDASSGAFFAWFVVNVVVVTLVSTFVWGTRRLRAVMLTCAAFFLSMSTLNEKLFPTPGIHWLAYDYRFYSAATAVCLVITGVVLLRLVNGSPQSPRKAALIAVLAAFSIIASTGHLISVARAYQRFDGDGTRYILTLLNDEKPQAPIHTPWNVDGSYLIHYKCLEEPDCNTPGSAFHDYGGDLYAVKIR